MCLCSQRDIGRFSSPSPLPHTLLPSHFTRSLSAGFADSAHFPCVSGNPLTTGIWKGDLNCSLIFPKQLQMYTQLLELHYQRLCLFQRQTHTLKRIRCCGWITVKSLRTYSPHTTLGLRASAKRLNTLKQRIMCSSQTAAVMWLLYLNLLVLYSLISPETLVSSQYPEGWWNSKPACRNASIYTRARAVVANSHLCVKMIN